MKKFLLVLCVAALGLTAKAQVYVGGSFGITHNGNTDVTTFTIAPEVGYKFSEKWAFAAELGYTHKNADANVNSFHVAPYARWSFFSKGMFRMFVDGGLGFSTSKVEDHSRKNGFEIGIKPGIALDLSKNFSFVTKYGFLGFRDDYKYNNSVSGISASSEDLSIGFLYTF